MDRAVFRKAQGPRQHWEPGCDVERCTGIVKDFWRNSSQKTQKSELDLGHSLTCLTRKCWQCLEKPRSLPVPKELLDWQGRQTHEHMQDVLCKECRRVPEKTSHLNIKTTTKELTTCRVSLHSLPSQTLASIWSTPFSVDLCWLCLIKPNQNKTATALQGRSANTAKIKKKQDLKTEGGKTGELLKPTMSHRIVGGVTPVNN